MRNFRNARGNLIDWVSTVRGSGFSNFLFVDKHFYSSPILRRIFSVARKLNYQSLAIEKIAEDDCALLTEENAALAIRESNYEGSTVRRLLFLATEQGADVGKEDLLGYAIFKEDRIQGSRIPHL